MGLRAGECEGHNVRFLPFLFLLNHLVSSGVLWLQYVCEGGVILEKDYFQRDKNGSWQDNIKVIS